MEAKPINPHPQKSIYENKLIYFLSLALFGQMSKDDGRDIAHNFLEKTQQAAIIRFG